MHLHRPIGENFIHICVDPQRMFLEHTEWHNPWLKPTLQLISLLVAADPARTVFTRFIPLRNKDEGSGTWRKYYEKWQSMTLDNQSPSGIDIVPDLIPFIPPARVIDKRVYSPWSNKQLLDYLVSKAIDTLIISGGETDVCVLATVLGAVDYGYRVILPKDAICSTCDETHEKTIDLYIRRFTTQVEISSVQQILECLPTSRKFFISPAR